MRDEFEALIKDAKPKRTITDEQWIVIHQVYQFYPTIKDVGGKGQVAHLFLEHGFPIFQDMLPRAEKLAELDHIRNRYLVEIETVDRQIQELSK
jgi:hypothetical protein